MWFLAALSLMVSVPEASQVVSSNAHLDHIQYSVMERHRTRIWDAYADGRTTYSEYDRHDVEVAGVDMRSPPQAFQAISESLRPLQTASQLTCDRPQRSAPDALLSWRRGVQTVELSMRHSCGSGDVEAAFRHLVASSRATSRLIRNDEWEEITPDMSPRVQKPVPAAASTRAAVIVPLSGSIDAIGYREIGVRGIPGKNWRVGSDGRGQFTYLPDTPEPAKVRAFAVEPAQFDRMVRELSGLENVPTACSEIADLHSAIGFWSWVRGDQTTTVRLEGACLSQLAEGADRIVADWMHAATNDSDSR